MTEKTAAAAWRKFRAHFASVLDDMSEVEVELVQTAFMAGAIWTSRALAGAVRAEAPEDEARIKAILTELKAYIESRTQSGTVQ